MSLTDFLISGYTLHAMQTIKGFFQSFIDAGQAWAEDRVSLYAAAIAYYLLFSMVPLMAMSMAIASFVLDLQVVEDNILNFIDQYIAPEAGKGVADFFKMMIDEAIRGAASTTAISAVILLIGASGIFNQLKRALDMIYGVIPRPLAGIKGAIKTIQMRSLGFAMVLLMGFLLMLVLLMNTFINTLSELLVERYPTLNAVLPSLNTYLLPLVMVFLFALLFKVLPHAVISWWDVLVGAAVTAVLVLLGNYLISIYMRISDTASVYGIFEALIVVLIWVFYTTQILLYGAEFTKAFAARMGRTIVPSKDGMYLAERLIERTAELDNMLLEPKPEQELAP